MEKSPIDLSRLTPNGNETDQDAAEGQEIGLLRPCPVRYDGTDKKLGGCDEMAFQVKRRLRSAGWLACSLGL